MKNYYTTEDIVMALDTLIVGDAITSDDVELFEQAMKRLESQMDIIGRQSERLEIAASYIGHSVITDMVEE